MNIIQNKENKVEKDFTLKVIHNKYFLVNKDRE